MKNERLFRAIGNIDDELVEAAAYCTQKKKKSVWIKLGTLAACMTLIIFTGTKLWQQESPGNIADLPMLSISMSNDGMGFEGYGAYDISELTNANPWSEDLNLSTLPVFKNPITYDERFQIASGSDTEKMRSLLLEAAGKLGLDPDVLTVTDDAPDEESKQAMADGFKAATGQETIPDGYFDPTILTVETEKLKLEVDQFLTVTVFFDPAISLPKEYSFAHGAAYTATSEYLKIEYKNLIGFDNPQTTTFVDDSKIHQQSYSVEFFDASGNRTEQIVNYNLNRITFHFDDEGKLFIARIFQPDLSEKVGDYPIITADEAKELLANGNYITTAPNRLPGMEYVKKVELVYRNDRGSEYFMPYYRFYVELPDMELDNGMKTYGAYYVPAVSEKYISNMSVWAGSFN